MGLDISYYSSWEPYPEEVRDWDHAEEIEDTTGARLFKVYNGADFEARASDMPAGKFVTAKYVHGFRAGSYSGYNHWRQRFCLAANDILPEVLWAMPEEEAQNYLFWEFIHFSDCEGVLGPACCQRLHEQMETHYEKIRKEFEEGPDAAWNLRLLDEWRKAFRVAAGKGMIRFH